MNFKKFYFLKESQKKTKNGDNFIFLKLEYIFLCNLFLLLCVFYNNLLVYFSSSLL